MRPVRVNHTFNQWIRILWSSRGHQFFSYQLVPNQYKKLFLATKNHFLFMLRNLSDENPDAHVEPHLKKVI